MKTLFIPTKIKSKINKTKILEISKKLPKNIAINYSIQYSKIAEQIKEILSEKHNILNFIQVLGCSRPIFSKETKAILLISSGRFHAISLAKESKLPVYILENNKLEKISQQGIELLEKKQKVSYMKFLHADKIGILISTKPGQENLGKAINLKKKIKNKKSYIFLSNQININEFENFPDIQSWVNTACPRLDFDSSIININKIKF
jgi:diphthamide biosynthesis enzyme Dph1/Dph2-like protein